MRADASTTLLENAVLHKAIHISSVDVMFLLLVICIALHSPDGGLVQYSRLLNKRAGTFINFWVLFQQAWTLFHRVDLSIS